MLSSILHLLAADPLSCHPPLLSPQMCSELDILDTELLQFQQDSALPNMLGESTTFLFPHFMLSVELRPSWWVGTEWEASVVLASELSALGA